MTTDEMKTWVDGASYKQLLDHWRFATIGDPFFRGEIGAYYTKKMKERRNAPGGNEQHVAASKSIG